MVRDWEMEMRRNIIKGQATEFNITSINQIFNDNNFTFCLHPNSCNHDSTHYFKILITYLLKQFPIERLAFSNSFEYRSQLQLFGGLGYPQIIQLVLEALLDNQAEANEIKSTLNTLFYKNPLSLLQWRQKVEEVVVEGPKWECHNCKKKFEEGKQAKFEKMEKEFCSMKCITDCRKKGGFN